MKFDFDNMKQLTKIFATFLILPVILLNLPFVSGAVCQSMPGMEKMSCCTPKVAVCEIGGAQLQKASCGCSTNRSAQSNANVISSSEIIRITSKELFKTSTAILSFDQNEGNTHLFTPTSFDRYQQPKFLHSQKIYVFVSAFLI